LSGQFKFLAVSDNGILQAGRFAGFIETICHEDDLEILNRTRWIGGVFENVQAT
jgi:hypothetical protein